MHVFCPFQKSFDWVTKIEGNRGETNHRLTLLDRVPFSYWYELRLKPGFLLSEIHQSPHGLSSFGVTKEHATPTCLLVLRRLTIGQ